MRDVELYRRPPFLVGDEPAVLRYRRRFRTRRRAVQAAFAASVVGVAVALRLGGADGLLPSAVAFGALSTAFMIGHLAVGKRKWMKPVEAFEDGIAASMVTFLFCRRRFIPWKDVEDLELRANGAGPPTLFVRAQAGRVLESVPGEFDEKAVAAMRDRMVGAKAQAAQQKALFDAVGREGSANP